MMISYDDKDIINTINCILQVGNTIECKHPEVLDDESKGSLAMWLGSSALYALKLLNGYASHKLSENDYSVYTESQLKDLIRISGEFVSTTETDELPSADEVGRLRDQNIDRMGQIFTIFEAASLTYVE